MRTGRPRITDDQHLSNIMVTDGCWIWMGPLDGRGYGCAGKIPGSNGRLIRYAHRWAYEFFVGPIPDGEYVLHSCDVRNCVNPDHLRTGSAIDNGNDMMVRGRHATARLSPDDVRAIRASNEKGIVLAARYGISDTGISEVRSRKRYAWVE